MTDNPTEKEGATAGKNGFRLDRSALGRPVAIHAMGRIMKGTIQAVKYKPHEALVYVDEGSFYWVAKSDLHLENVL